MGRRDAGLETERVQIFRQAHPRVRGNRHQPRARGLPRRSDCRSVQTISRRDETKDSAMRSELIGELLSTVRAGKNELVRQNALDLLYKLAADGDRGARRAIAAIERAKILRDEQKEHRSEKR